MLTLQNIPKATQMAFSDYMDNSDKKLNKLLSLLNADNPLNEMIKEDFQFHFNKLFAPVAIKDEASRAFPSSINKYTSIWLSEWSKHFDDKYQGFKTPLKEMSFEKLNKEADNILKSFTQNLNIEQARFIKQKLLDSVPYSGEEENRYQTALKNTVFNMAVIKHFDFQDVAEEISESLKCYYAVFDNGSNNAYKNYAYGKDVAQLKIAKLKEFSPKTENDIKVLLFLSTNKELFMESFNKTLGVSNDKDGMNLAELFHNIIVKQNHDKLDSEIPKKLTETVKKKKI